MTFHLSVSRCVNNTS